MLPTIIVLEADNPDLDSFVLGVRECPNTELAPLQAMGLGSVAELILVGTASLNGIVFSIDFLYRRFRRGMIVEDSAGQIVIRSSSELPRGTIIMRGPDGHVQVRDGSQLRNMVTEWVSTLHKSDSSD